MQIQRVAPKKKRAKAHSHGSSKYRKGRRLEYLAANEMRRKRGTVCVVRASGSHGPFDLIRIQKRKSGEMYVTLVQVKTRKPNEKEIASLAAMAYGRFLLAQVWIWIAGNEFEKWQFDTGEVGRIPAWFDAVTGLAVKFKTRRSKRCF